MTKPATPPDRPESNYLEPPDWLYLPKSAKPERKPGSDSDPEDQTAYSYFPGGKVPAKPDWPLFFCGELLPPPTLKQQLAGVLQRLKVWAFTVPSLWRRPDDAAKR